MDCPTCVITLEKSIKQVMGVKDAKGNYLKKTIKVTYDPDVAKLTDIEKAIENLGYFITYKHYMSPIERLQRFFKDGDKAIKNLTDKDFIRQITNNTQPAIVLFSSKMCPACQAIKPKLEQLLKQQITKYNFYEMDIAITDTWKEYNIIGIPTIILFREGKPTEHFGAVLNLEELKKAMV